MTCQYHNLLQTGWSRDRILAGTMSSAPALGPTQPSVKWVPVLFPGLKQPGHGVDHQPPSSAELKERVELYF